MSAKRITDDDLIGITDKLISDAAGHVGGDISERRSRNMSFYLAQATGELAPPSIDGRSAVVSTDVSDTVEWMLPSVVKTFTAGDDVVEFAPRRQQDEAAARQATDYCNYILHKQNPGFQLVYTWIKDALLQVTGVMKVWWDDSTEDVREQYRGLTDAQAQMLLQDADVEPIEHATVPDPNAEAVAQSMAAMGLPFDSAAAPMLHDITVKRRKPAGRVCIENVPPEEFLISPRAKTIGTAPFVGHRVEKTISDLRAAGYENVDDIGSDDDSERGAYADIDGYHDKPEHADESQRRVWITECYLQLDYNGDGISEWRQVVRCGGVVLRNEECDGPPFVALTPIPVPHRFFGLCPADQAIEPQRLKTSLLRAALDGLYLSINGRTFAVDGQVNLDDLLTSRPGGVVRVKAPGMVGPLMEGKADLGAASAMLEYAEVMKENRTGFTRYSQGTSADALNQTATGVNLITNRADSRIELIARVFAETGFQDLFRRILQLVSQYQDKAEVARVNGKWVDFDPRTWATQFDFTVNVGLGTGNKDQMIQHLTVLGQAQKEAAGLGLAGPEQVFNLMKKFSEALGFKQPELFFTDPSGKPPQPPRPDPKMIEVQGKQNEAIARMQLEREKVHGQLALDRERLEAEINLKRLQLSMTMQADQEAAMYQRINAQTEALVNGPQRPAIPGYAVAQGDFQGTAGPGGAGQPAVPGGGFIPPGQPPSSMGIQPSA